MFLSLFGDFGNSCPQHEFAARNRPRTTVFAVDVHDIDRLVHDFYSAHDAA